MARPSTTAYAAAPTAARNPRGTEGRALRELSQRGERFFYSGSAPLRILAITLQADFSYLLLQAR